MCGECNWPMKDKIDWKNYKKELPKQGQEIWVAVLWDEYLHIEKVIYHLDCELFREKDLDIQDQTSNDRIRLIEKFKKRIYWHEKLENSTSSEMWHSPFLHEKLLEIRCNVIRNMTSCRRNYYLGYLKQSNEKELLQITQKIDKEFWDDFDKYGFEIYNLGLWLE
jgi:hypothetical protein